MKRILVILSLLVFVGVYAAPALTMTKDVAAKIVTVDKDKKKASKAKQADASKETTKAACGEANCAATCKEAAACKGTAKAACCEGEKATTHAACGEKNCAATCKEAAACKGTAAKSSGEKK